ncbi:BlaI/MecI/CopY family transcriptional regulator [Actinomadura rudentiformis]|nr:BlaI/MecI/CopY family transcriptional regulator [Actinomadura rudentiformis]
MAYICPVGVREDLCSKASNPVPSPRKVDGAAQTEPLPLEVKRVRGSLEKAILHVLWSTDQELRGQEVLDQFNRTRHEPIAYPTVMTVLKRLIEKGAVVRRKSGRAYMYRPTCGDPVGLDVRRVLKAHGEEAVARFVEQAAADPGLRTQLLTRVNEHRADCMHRS